MTLKNAKNNIMSKNWFSEHVIDLGGDDKPATPPKKIAATPQQTPLVFQDSEGGPQVSVSVNSDDLNQFRKHFSDLLSQNNQPGNDYYELIAAKNAMNAIPIEAQRYEVAFAGLSAAGLTKDVVIKS